MDVNVLTSKLENQPDKIIQILEALGFENIKFNPLKIICGSLGKSSEIQPVVCLIAARFGSLFSLQTKKGIFSV